MRYLLILLFFAFCGISLKAQSKLSEKLNSVYENGNYKKLYKRAVRAAKKNKKDPVAYYYISLANYGLYKQYKYRSNLSYSIINLKKARKFDKNASYWESLENNFSALKKTMATQATFYFRKNKNKSLQFCKNYTLIFGDSLVEHAELEKLRNQTVKERSTPKPSLSITKSSLAKRDSMKYIAHSCIGTPYKWAGESKKGFDCSGFVKYVYDYVGIKLPHNANKIAHLGKEVSEKSAQTGDVILFGSKSKNGFRAYHSGIIYENEKGEIKLIHSISKGVHITSDYDRYWKERTLFIKNIIDFPKLNNELTLKSN
tara:strand:+ start:353 stop:1294 length:942 start_codon:yes stop_codon:yes gene_type:complete